MGALEEFFASRDPRDGWHTHRCPRCASRWQHHGQRLGDADQAHACPVCGRHQFRVEAPLSSRSIVLPEVDGNPAPGWGLPITAGLVIGGLCLALLIARANEPENPP